MPPDGRVEVDPFDETLSLVPGIDDDLSLPSPASNIIAALGILGRQVPVQDYLDSVPGLRQAIRSLSRPVDEAGRRSRDSGELQDVLVASPKYFAPGEIWLFDLALDVIAMLGSIESLGGDMKASARQTAQICDYRNDWQKDDLRAWRERLGAAGAGPEAFALMRSQIPPRPGKPQPLPPRQHHHRHLFGGLDSVPGLRQAIQSLSELRVVVRWGLVPGIDDDLSLPVPVSSIMTMLRALGDQVPVQDYLDSAPGLRQAIRSLSRPVAEAGRRIRDSAELQDVRYPGPEYFAPDEIWLFDLALDVIAMLGSIESLRGDTKAYARRAAHVCDYRDDWHRLRAWRERLWAAGAGPEAFALMRSQIPPRPGKPQPLPPPLPPRRHHHRHLFGRE